MPAVTFTAPQPWIHSIPALRERSAPTYDGSMRRIKASRLSGESKNFNRVAGKEITFTFSHTCSNTRTNQSRALMDCILLGGKTII